MKKKSRSVVQILWAIDPFEQSSKVVKGVEQMLSTLSKFDGKKVLVQPVYVIPPKISGTLEFYYPQDIDVQTEALAAMKRQASKVGISGMMPPKVLTGPSSTTAGAVRLLTDYASRFQADLILVGTHARKGVPRLFLGSFAESLVLHSPVPVLTVRTAGRATKKTKKILFPTDFSEGSKKVFAHVLGTAKSLQADVTVFHVDFRPNFGFSGSRWKAIRKEALQQEGERGLRLARPFLDLAKAAGVRAVFEAIASSHSPAEAVAGYATRHGFQMIAMSAKSGGVSSLILGSVARQVVRTSDVPVWIQRE